MLATTLEVIAAAIVLVRAGYLRVGQA